MPLTAGDKLGPYEILALIGAGGMGEVYKAHDPRLGRDVAIKVSAERFSERFEREARAVAALNHPNICSLFDVGPNFLVMELVEGEAPQGPLPLETALAYARQIAAALDEAHEKNVVHRDLKPGNIKIKPDGTVKVLDFGLAKVGVTPSASSENSPTISMAATQAGVILGTAAYMAPEQARGKPIDRRADIWAFGVVLYEMLTGERLFKGEDITETLAAVVMKEPDLGKVPAEMRPLLQRCLEKDPKKRLRAAGDMDLLLVEQNAAPSPSRFGRAGWAVAAAAVLALAALAFIHFREQAPAAEVVRFTVSPPENATLASYLTMSPNGRMIAFAAQEERDGRRRLWVRTLDVFQAKPLADITNSANPFWSPDSRFLAFQADGKLKRVDMAGSPPVNLCEVSPLFRGGAWSQSGTIIFGTANTGLLRVSQAGGVPAPLTALDASRGETYHGEPFFLPDGRHFIYLRRSGSSDNQGIYIGSLDNAPEKQPLQRLLAASTQAQYVASPDGGPGHLLFLRDNTLMAQPFDAAKLAFAGDPAPVTDPVRSTGDLPLFSASASTGLTYLAGGSNQQQLTWLDRSGKAVGTAAEPGVYREAALSPDGSQAAVDKNGDIWVVEFARNSSSRLTSDPAIDRAPVWSPDGKRVLFESSRDGSGNLYIKDANGATPEELFYKSSEEKTPTSWSRDGRFLLYTSVGQKTGSDIWWMPAPGSSSAGADAKPKPFLQTPFAEGQSQFSPDGHWVVYMSTESGTNEVYVRSFPDAGNKVKVSVGGGYEPRWSTDGKEIFYRPIIGRRLMVVAATTSPTFKPESPKLLFEAALTGAGDANRTPNYFPTSDGKRFLAPMSPEAGVSEPITVLLNWQASLKK
jgi:Tol biopolymer transport system component